MKIFLISCCLSLVAEAAVSQPVGTSASGSNSFINYQKTFPRPSESFARKEDTLQKQFKEKKLTWPANYIYIRSFKYDSQLEVWVKQEIQESFKLFKTYKVCALAGSLGPKRMEGDYQVPEGFYYINEFNPKSSYYLSLGINYPNESDKVLSDSLRPGSAIYIHGSCVTVGCIPITDEQIDELYILAAHAKNQGQDFIPVHIFPIKFDVEKSANYLSSLTKDDAGLKKFAENMEDAYNYFEKHRQLPMVMIGDKGQYIINDAPLRKPEVIIEEKPVKKAPIVHRTRKIDEISDLVHQWPQYPGGGGAYMNFLEKVGAEMVSFLPKGFKKAFVQVEFVVDKDGTPVNFKVLKGTIDPSFADELISRMEKMQNWQPALLQERPVPKKMIQTVVVE